MIKGIIYRGNEKVQLVLTRELFRYSYTGDSLSMGIKYGMLTEDIKKGDFVTVVIEDPDNGNIEKFCRFISYNYVVFDSTSREPGEVTLSDNTMLFEVIE